MKKTLLSIITTFAGVTATFADVSATQSTANGLNSLKTLVESITNGVLASVGTLFLTLAVVAFFWGVVQYIWGAREANANKIKEGNQFMIWSVVALFVMFSVYGIIKFGQGILGQDTSTITIPRLGTGGSGTSVPAPTNDADPLRSGTSVTPLP